MTQPVSTDTDVDAIRPHLVEGPRPFWSGRRLPANAGVDFLRQGPPTFHDVADVQGLQLALTHVHR